MSLWLVILSDKRQAMVERVSRRVMVEVHVEEEGLKKVKMGWGHEMKG